MAHSSITAARLGLILCGIINGYMKRRTDGELEKRCSLRCFKTLVVMRGDCIHGGGDERNELLGIPADVPRLQYCASQ